MNISGTNRFNSGNFAFNGIKDMRSADEALKEEERTKAQDKTTVAIGRFFAWGNEGRKLKDLEVTLTLGKEREYEHSRTFREFVETELLLEAETLYEQQRKKDLEKQRTRVLNRASG